MELNSLPKTLSRLKKRSASVVVVVVGTVKLLLGVIRVEMLVRDIPRQPIFLVFLSIAVYQNVGLITLILKIGTI